MRELRSSGSGQLQAELKNILTSDWIESGYLPSLTLALGLYILYFGKTGATLYLTLYMASKIEVILTLFAPYEVSHSSKKAQFPSPTLLYTSTLKPNHSAWGLMMTTLGAPCSYIVYTALMLSWSLQE